MTKVTKPEEVTQAITDMVCEAINAINAVGGAHLYFATSPQTLTVATPERSYRLTVTEVEVGVVGEDPDFEV